LTCSWLCGRAGVARCLRSKDAAVRVYRIDPPGACVRDVGGSGGAAAAAAAAAEVAVDGAFDATEAEVVEMSHWLVRNEGLFVGRAAALNVCGCVLPPYLPLRWWR
jgi:cysteine synthase A